MAKSLEESLENGIVLIKFKSLRSGNIHEREYSLSSDYVKNPIAAQSGDRIICYDLEFQKWEDIDKQTIIEWRAL